MPSSKRNAGLCLLIAAALVLGADYWLYSARGFLRHYGYGMQEGQVVAKMDRARIQASVADVIFLGSSTIRCNIASRPFLDAGLLPLNLGVTGGGPLYSYYALKALAPVLERRSTKPVLVLEVSAVAMQVAPGSIWSEYQHLFAVARSRFEIAHDFPALYSNFRTYDQTSLFLATWALPSLSYRAVAPAVGGLPVSELPMLFGTGRGMNMPYLAIEDPWGYAPLYETETIQQAVNPPVMWNIAPCKRQFLRATVQLAHRLGMPVVLLESTVIGFGTPPDAVFEEAAHEAPGARAIRYKNCDFRREDFQDAHLNDWGADRLSARLVAMLGLKGDKRKLEEKEHVAGDRADVPATATWHLPQTGVSIATDESRAIVFDRKAGVPNEPAESPSFPTIPGTQYVLEFEVRDASGRVCVVIGPEGAPWQSGYNSADTCTSDTMRWQTPAARFYLRYTPQRSRSVIRVYCAGKANQARVRMVSLFRER
ncbi:MAG TPA: hypothetical protein VKE70_11515 [Candidatus Solibacter sp.]|nr:hypothetical protein [Candidatus Solibacter sp.]